jgi:uncharacterized protein
MVKYMVTCCGYSIYSIIMKMPSFEWDTKKNAENTLKHGISFEIAQYAFDDPKRVIALDLKHSTTKEKRYFCYAFYKGAIITVRFTWRKETIRIFGAGYWREGRNFYYEKNKIH